MRSLQNLLAYNSHFDCQHFSSFEIEVCISILTKLNNTANNFVVFIKVSSFFQTVSKCCCCLCCCKLNNFRWILMIILKDCRSKHSCQQKSYLNVGNFLEKMLKAKVKILQISNKQEIQLNLVLITGLDMWDIILQLSMQNSWETQNLKLNRADGKHSFNCYFKIKRFDTST